jgi:predicted nuclease of predicted toxin-antitoxin system
VKLLFDENLSPKLAINLNSLFPNSQHVDRIGLGGASDDKVWDYTKDNGYLLISKDADFYDKSVLLGYPPKVIWIRRGNCSNRQLELLLRNKVDAITAFNNASHLAFMQIL